MAPAIVGCYFRPINEFTSGSVAHLSDVNSLYILHTANKHRCTGKWGVFKRLIASLFGAWRQIDVWRDCNGMMIRFCCLILIDVSITEIKSSKMFDKYFTLTGNQKRAHMLSFPQANVDVSEYKSIFHIFFQEVSLENPPIPVFEVSKWQQILIMAFLPNSYHIKDVSGKAGFWFKVLRVNWGRFI